MRGDLGYDTPQAQHKAQDIPETCALLELHLEGSWTAPSVQNGTRLYPQATDS